MTTPTEPGIEGLLPDDGSLRAQEPSAPGGDGDAWRPIASVPRDGTPFWAFLYQTGIRRLEWWPPERCAEYEGGDVADYDGCFVECDNHHLDWSPAFWLPLEALPPPPATPSEGG